MDSSSAISSLQQRLRVAQAKARRLRAEAYVRYSPVVAGERLNAITLDTYNLLVAWENPFVCGGSATFDALFQFIWAHHPEFSQFDAAARRRVLRRVLRALQPRHPNLSAIARFLCPVLSGLRPPASRLQRLLRAPCSLLLRVLRARLEPSPSELELAAIAECSRLVVEAVGEFPTDSPPPDAKSGAIPDALPFSMQAQVLGLMCREFGLPFHVTRALPLKELSQHLREVAWIASRGKVALLSQEEAAIWHDYERAKEAELNEQSKLENQKS